MFTQDRFQTDPVRKSDRIGLLCTRDRSVIRSGTDPNGSKTGPAVLQFQFWIRLKNAPSSETQGQLVGTTGFSWAKVYNKSGRAPGHLLLPIQFQKRLSSLLLIFSWPISEEEQPGDSHGFLHEVVFLIDRRSSVARSTGTILRRASEKKQINKRSRGNRKL